MDPRAINFNVLRRHDPRISSILDSTSYAVIYRYFHGAWSKTGFEGTLFIFQRDSHPLHGVFVLNRQGLDNLCEGLLAGWDVDLDEGLIIWRSAGATGDADDDVIYGIWVYEEKDRTRIATTMQELINSASVEKKDVQQPSSPSPPPVSLSHPVPRVPIISAGQTISLDQLFGVGSVCSEPPPQTSALPHPGTSVVDPEEQQDNFLPAKIMSPDASDLPKGMQLLDSLFQKAAIKSQNSHQLSTKVEPAHQHPQSIHQLINQASASASKKSSQTSLAKSTPTKSKKDRHQNSTEETYHNQSAGIAHHANHRASHTSRSEYRSLNHSNNNSRRSSGGSSSRSRNDQLPIGTHINPHAHQYFSNSSNPTSLVAAPVPIENANAEARHNILSLLGHPAASQTNPQNQSSRRETPNSHYRGDPTNNPPGSHSGSQTAFQQPSPRSNNQQTAVQHPLPTPSYGNLTNPSPPGAAIHSATHSPNGPRPQADSRHHAQAAASNPAGDSPSSLGSSGGQMGPGFSTTVWPFNKLPPNRALSPLNPARQSPSNFNQRRGGYRQSSHRNPPGSQQKQAPADASPPHINDSSRPLWAGSHAGSNGSNSTRGIGSPAAPPPPHVVNSKIAVDLLDELITADPASTAHKSAGHPEASPLDKSQFVDGILSLIHNNGPFVDTLYARYLARYAERYL